MIDELVSDAKGLPRLFYKTFIIVRNMTDIYTYDVPL